MNYQTDNRIVLTLDAGGTNFAFSAIRQGEEMTQPVTLPAEANDLEASLNNLISGFEQLVGQLSERPSAISFAFPGPADYPRGIIYNVGNLPAYQGGVAVGPMLEGHFDLPVYINNDGDLFAYGEAIAGLLPEVNRMLAEAGSPKRYQNLFAVTLGTGFGGGIVQNGQLFLGDNSAAGEIWILRNKIRSDCFAEEGASIRAVQSAYAAAAGIDAAAAPPPKEIFKIGMGQKLGNQVAAQQAFETLGEVVGDAMANALTLIDGLAIIGGGLAGAAPLFMPRLVQEMNGTICKYNGETIPRLAQRVYDLTNEQSQRDFLRGESKEIAVPRSDRTILCDPLKRIGVGISQLGTNRAVAIGAYAYALQQLDNSIT
ncbi:ROK family protein [Adhaeretor mobilis]|uniref:N-acetyl-D-glucosamine kinase n=1 Tax=Adhaeretor mobilis TaxID=1930276 RepID=A0A517N197_9BACT|nr:ROK family protein [Adhaeretor mobilis]QDT00903.1 N-acetyl-D-glucosamine kinase [Adhaeretor mobilis]